jgi:hypothetical protein
MIEVPILKIYYITQTQNAASLRHKGEKVYFMKKIALNVEDLR